MYKTVYSVPACDTWFILWNPWFLRQHFLSIFLYAGNVLGWVSVDYLSFWKMESKGRNARTRGGGRVGSFWWLKDVCGCAHKIILAHDLLRQAEARYQIPVRILVPQGIGGAISADHAGIWSRNRNFYPANNPATHVWNGYVNFLCHESTQTTK